MQNLKDGLNNDMKKFIVDSKWENTITETTLEIL